MDPITLSLDALVVESFTAEPEITDSVNIVETGCVQPCEGDGLVWK
jgi:hypothetical protein